MNSKKERLLIGSLVFALTLSFSLLYLNRYVVDNFMWNEFNAILYQLGQFPYRDFFVYVPPALLLKMHFLWFAFGQKLIVIVIAGMIERALMFTLLYVVLSKWARPLYAFVGTLLSYLLLMNAPFDTVGDYSWMCMTLALICVYCLQWFFENREKHPVLSYVFLAFAFFFGMLNVMTKQSNGLILTLAMLLLMIIYFVCRRGHHVVWGVLAISGGIAVGLAPWLIWLGANDALVPFFQQVFGAALNSKGVSGSGAAGTTVFNSFLSVFSWDYSLIFLLSLVIYIMHDYYHKDPKRKKLVILCAGGAISIIVLVELIVTLFRLPLTNETILTSGLVWLAILILALITIRYLPSKQRNAVSSAAVLFVGFTLAWALVSLSDSTLRTAIIQTNVISNVGTVFSHTAMMICFTLCFRITINAWLDRGENTLRWQRFTLIVAGLTMGIGAMVGSGIVDYMGTTCFITIPFLLCEALRLLEPLSANVRIAKRTLHIRNCHRAVLTICAVLICMMSCVVMSRKIQSPCTWWGITTEEITDADSYTIDYDMYDGYLVSKAQKTRYEQIGRLIEDNSDPDDFVLTFPYAVIYKIQTERFEAPTDVCVYFFDVCPDNMAISDLEIIKENPPKIIVWMDVGYECWDVHEFLFRGGNRMGQRDIQDWFNEVKNTEYQLIGRVDNQYVYRIKDGTPINYTYFATKHDMMSNADSVSDNIRNSDYLRKLTSMVTSTPVDRTTPLFVVSAILLVSLALFALFSGLPLWKSLLVLFGALYLILPCKPALISIYFAPLLIMLSSTDIRDKKCWPWLCGMLGVILLCLVGWWDIWRIWVQYVVLSLIVAMMLCAIVQSVLTVRARMKGRCKDNTIATEHIYT